jgi:diguanylate cyclase (GGDEF)-like protein
MSVPILGRWFGQPARSTASLAVPARAPMTPVAVRASDGPRDASTVDDTTLGRVVDAVGALIQTIGVYAHDAESRTAEEARRAAERWKRHLTLGVEHPASGNDVAPEGATGAAPAPRRGVSLRERDWEGAARFAIDDRRAEHAHVQRTVAELRETIWALVHGVHEVVGAETAAGAASVGAIDRARGALVTADPASVRDVALATMAELARLLTDRQRERDQQVAALGAQVASLAAALDEARREGASDPLTGLGNRRAFDASTERAVALHTLLAQPVCLLVVDVDAFKRVNDDLGHAAGDVALQAVTHHLSRVFLRRTDLAVRIGGDEFAVLLRDTAEDEAMRLARRLATGLAEHPVRVLGPPRDAELHVSVSAGVARLRAGESATEWYARADSAMYAAKRAGGGRVELSS